MMGFIKKDTHGDFKFQDKSTPSNPGPEKHNAQPAFLVEY
jgi:hypothetical protein